MLNGADGLIFGFPTRLTAITMLAHHGMIYVPIGYMFRHCMFKMKEVKGGSLYGAGTYVGDGTRQVLRLNCCKHSTGRIFLPPSPRSSRMLHKAYNVFASVKGTLYHHNDQRDDSIDNEYKGRRNGSKEKRKGRVRKRRREERKGRLSAITAVTWSTPASRLTAMESLSHASPPVLTKRRESETLRQRASAAGNAMEERTPPALSRLVVA
ncbi:hypothetical protein Ahy_A08g039498 [Arachis hypogaea]|uniref:Uncharacterized protein n=1 Tax=Arachis hypogaea TaxID=3818 RepID=A0A445BWG9_ARAHY|nr:hypothetical protein Ahy_A08g039498 [Arachis hypogaea]